MDYWGEWTIRETTHKANYLHVHRLLNITTTKKSPVTVCLEFKAYFSFFNSKNLLLACLQCHLLAGRK